MKMNIVEANAVSCLWIGKAPINGGGDEIYDRKIVGGLAGDIVVTRRYIRPLPRLRQILAGLSGVPFPRFRYSDASLKRELSREARTFDAVVISWEALDYYAKSPMAPCVLVSHNVTSDLVGEIFGRSVLMRILAAPIRFWERQRVTAAGTVVCVLSQRDKRLIDKIAGSDIALVVPPGLPPASPLNEAASFMAEVYISGSYDWWPKRRDLKRFVAEWSEVPTSLKLKHDGHVPVDIADALAIERLHPAEFSEAIRLGVLVDRFLGGFKLKLLYYIANNCICVSFFDFSEEFSEIEDHEFFFRRIRAVPEIASIAAELEAMCPRELRERMAAFKRRCEERFSWASTAQPLSDAIRSISLDARRASPNGLP